MEKEKFAEEILKVRDEMISNCEDIKDLDLQKFSYISNILFFIKMEESGKLFKETLMGMDFNSLLSGVK